MLLKWEIVFSVITDWDDVRKTETPNSDNKNSIKVTYISGTFQIKGQM
jgi:hypothetical protein